MATSRREAVFSPFLQIFSLATGQHRHQIWYETVKYVVQLMRSLNRQGRALMAIGVTSEDLFAVVWTMIECRDPESEWRIVWETLPKNLSTGRSPLCTTNEKNRKVACTGLSFGEEHVELLRGTDAYEEIRSAQKVWCAVSNVPKHDSMCLISTFPAAMTTYSRSCIPYT